jgi:hypothetical protein
VDNLLILVEKALNAVLFLRIRRLPIAAAPIVFSGTTLR